MYFNHQTTIYLDGKYVRADETLTNLYGQTLHYGYGVFEGIRSYATTDGAKLFKARAHYERLKRSCELIKIPFDYDIDELIEATYKTLEANTLFDAYVRPLVFCAPNMSLDRPAAVSIMICAWDWGAYLGEDLLNVSLSSYCRPHPKSVHIEAKACGHYVNSIIATTDAKDKGFDEALLLDHEGYLAEGSSANLFFEKDGVLYTPELGSILPGITRATVIELAQQAGIEVCVGKFKPEMFYEADSAFFCGTAAGIIGIETLDQTDFPKPWKYTLGYKLKEAYEKHVRQTTPKLTTTLV